MFFKLTITFPLLLALLTAKSVVAETNFCTDSSIRLQVLGSGGPELTKHRASSSYLIWVNDEAVILMDSGAGSALRFTESGADWKHLKVVLFSHFHADHSSDFAALVKASWFGERTEDLPVYGPFGNNSMPSTKAFIKALFDQQNGAYKYLSDFYNNQNEEADYRIIANEISKSSQTNTIYSADGIHINAQQVKHGPIPAIAYQVNICGKSIVYSGDTNGKGFEYLSTKNTDVFVAHNAIPENAGPVAQSLHMTPLKIGQIAEKIHAKKVILSHRMNRTLGAENQTINAIKKHYDGPLVFADDLDVFELKSIQ